MNMSVNTNYVLKPYDPQRAGIGATVSAEPQVQTSSAQVNNTNTNNYQPETAQDSAYPEQTEQRTESKGGISASSALRNIVLGSAIGAGIGYFKENSEG